MSDLLASTLKVLIGLFFIKSSIYPIAASWMLSISRSASMAWLIDSTPKTFDTWLIMSSNGASFGALKKIRPWCLFISNLPYFVNLPVCILTLSTRARSKYGLFLPFRAVSPHRKISMFSSFILPPVRGFLSLSSSRPLSLAFLLYSPFLQLY